MTAAPSRDLSERESSNKATTLVIRRATLNDLEVVVSIWAEGQRSQGDIPTDLDEIARVFRHRIESTAQAYGIWVAEISGTIVGWQGLHHFRANPIHDWAESSTYVREANKGHGVGRLLLTFATEHAQRVGLHSVMGFIKGNNPAPMRIRPDGN